MINEREEAYKVILEVFKNNTFSENLLEKSGDKIRKQNGNHDLFYRLVKGVIKMRRRLDWVAARHTDPERFKNTDLRIRTLISLGLYQMIFCDLIPDHAGVNETVELTKKLFDQKVADFVNAVLRNAQREPNPPFPEDPVERMAVEYSFPVGLIRTWIAEWGEDDTEMLCMYFNDIPRLSIRVNRLATTPERLAAYFAKREIVLEPCQASPAIYSTSQAWEVLVNVALTEGYLSIQDPSQAMVVELLHPKEDDSVLDLFAGLGGKSTYLGELLKNTGEVIAVDRIPNKIKRLKQAAERLQITNIEPVVEDAFEYGPVAPAFDRVLLDVPCSGWGVFQKKAELRWQAAQDIPQLLKLQENALIQGARFVKPGGYMVYSTCTMNRDENERQVEKFLAQHPDFEKVDAANRLPREYVRDGYLKTIPHKHLMDGAFAAKLRKKPKEQA
jgi:16S rRNA (cytosine967-C5)-methyltransferase